MEIREQMDLSFLYIVPLLSKRKLVVSYLNEEQPTSIV